MKAAIRGTVLVLVSAPWPTMGFVVCGGASNDAPQGTTVVTAFELADQYFKGKNLRTIVRFVFFPGDPPESPTATRDGLETVPYKALISGGHWRAALRFALLLLKGGAAPL